jgi:phage terminase large subunit GpA-like protein
MRDYLKAFSNGLRPEQDLTVSEWADKYRILDPASSSEAGRWRTSRTPYLREVMDSLSATDSTNITVFMKGAQIGAALALSTPIATVEGWITMGEIQEGDIIFTELGATTKVGFVSEVMRGHTCYEVCFDTGDPIVADAEHRWVVINNDEKITCTTEHLLTLKGGIFIERAEAVRLPVVTDLPLCPYALGYWLAGLEINDYTINCPLEDFEYIKGYIHNDHTSFVSTDAEISFDEDIQKFMYSLLTFGKVIPDSYLRASFLQRIQLICGLMDSGGNIDEDGFCTFVTQNGVLGSCLYELLVSVGLKADMRDVGNDYLVVEFYGYKHTPTFGLPHKWEALMDEDGDQHPQIRIHSIDEVDSVPVRCISVDNPTRLYLAGTSMVPTHNTEAGNNWVGYMIHHAPAPMLYVMPTVETIKRTSKQRIAPMIASVPELAERVADQRSKDSSNTLSQKDFKGGTLVMTGANSAVGLRSMPARYLFLDEVDAYPNDLDGEGDPIQLAMRRTSTYKRGRKIFIISTPTIKGLSTIEQYYEQSDKRRYYVPCPECGTMQTIEWPNIKWENNDPDTAKLECESCKTLISEYQKTKMLAEGEWRATSKGRHRGYHLSSLYSPAGWYGWGDAVTDFLPTKQDSNLLKTFVNTVLGETWEERGEELEADTLSMRRVDYDMPPEVRIVTAAIDVQDNRVEFEVVGWARGEVSYALDYKILRGDLTTREFWDKLHEMLQAQYDQHRISLVCIDSGGHFTDEVYTFCKRRPSVYVPIKGANQVGKPIVTYPQTKNKHGVFLVMVGTDTAKEVIFARFANDQQDFWSMADCFDPEYFAQMTSEKKVTRWIKGRKCIVWTPTRKRNEALDCRVYNLAAIRLLQLVKGLDLGNKESKEPISVGRRIRRVSSSG